MTTSEVLAKIYRCKRNYQIFNELKTILRLIVKVNEVLTGESQLLATLVKKYLKSHKVSLND